MTKRDLKRAARYVCRCIDTDDLAGINHLRASALPLIRDLCAALEAAQDALRQAEACMSIVEPRSDKAEYLRILGVVRKSLTTTQQGQA